MSQQPSRPWFRLASMVRPPPPTRPAAPAPIQPQPFRPQLPLGPPAAQGTPRPPPPILPSVTPRSSAPSSPILPTTPARNIAPPLPTPTPTPAPAPAPAPTPAAPPRLPATAPPPSPSKTPVATLTSPATRSPKSPAKTGETQPTIARIKSPITTSAQSPPPPISAKPTSPIAKPSSSLPASPGQKASPHIPVARPDISYSALPSSPKTKTSAPPPSPLPTSPDFKTVPSSPIPPQTSTVSIAAPTQTVTARVTSPMASPKIYRPWIETPPQSNKEKLLSHPPSPLTLPPAQIKEGSGLEPIPAEVEQKTVLLQETEEKSKAPPKISNGYMLRPPHGETPNNNIAQHGKREVKKDKSVHTYHKKHSDSEEFRPRVVTLAGENKGAIMELSPSRKKNGSGGVWSINGGQKLKSDSDEGSSRMKDEKHMKAAPMETAPMDAFINCNIQGVNNSILYNCSCSHNDPGVHLSVSRKNNGGHGFHN